MTCQQLCCFVVVGFKETIEFLKRLRVLESKFGPLSRFMSYLDLWCTGILEIFPFWSYFVGVPPCFSLAPSAGQYPCILSFLLGKKYGFLFICINSQHILIKVKGFKNTEKNLEPQFKR